MVVLIARNLAEACRQFLLEWVLHGVAVETEFVYLLGDCLDIVRVAVTDADDCMTAIEVEIFLPLVVPHAATFAFVDGYVEKWIYVK